MSVVKRRAVPKVIRIEDKTRLLHEIHEELKYLRTTILVHTEQIERILSAGRATRSCLSAVTRKLTSESHPAKNHRYSTDSHEFQRSEP
jgi:hypothetical protein